jgi:hypothetical protein
MGRDARWAECCVDTWWERLGEELDSFAEVPDTKEIGRIDEDIRGAVDVTASISVPGSCYRALGSS